MALNVLARAPDFILPSSSGQDFQLSTDVDGQPLILYFYPRDFTQGCTKQACSFRDHFENFRELDIRVIGISTDSVAKHQAFIQHHDLPFELLSDKEGAVSKIYKARIPWLNLSKRITYLLDSNHKIAAVYDSFFNSENHIRKMLEEVRNKS